MDTPDIRTEAIAEFERMIAWLKEGEALPLIGCVTAKMSLRLMGKRPR